MSGWTVAYAHEAIRDMKRLDHSQQIVVVKAIDKVSVNPLPVTEGGYGKPLGNQVTGNLSGYLKIKLRSHGMRIVYRLSREETAMRVLVVSVRDDDTVYKMAQQRGPGAGCK